MNVKKFSALNFFYWGRKSRGVILQHAQKSLRGLNPNMVESFMWDAQVSNYKQKSSVNK